MVFLAILHTFKVYIWYQHYSVLYIADSEGEAGKEDLDGWKVGSFLAQNETDFLGKRFWPDRQTWQFSSTRKEVKDRSQLHCFFSR